MTFLTLSSVSLLARLAGLAVVSYAVWMLTQRLFKTSGWKWLPSKPKLPTLSLVGAYRAIRPVTINACLIAVAFTMGYLTRDAALVNRMTTWTNVRVLNNEGKGNYHLRIPGGDTPHVTFCDDPDWDAGTILTEITFEQLSRCKRIAGHGVGFHVAQAKETYASTR